MAGENPLLSLVVAKANSSSVPGEINEQVFETILLRFKRRIFFKSYLV